MKNTNIEKLRIEATKAYENAYAPYSKFSVGAAILDENGNIHIGCNVENAAYPSGSCAEENAIGKMISSGGRVIKEILILAKSDLLVTPCGACRQRIREFYDKSTLIHIASAQNGFQESFSLDTLLPYSFGPENL
ncbi:MAG: cytidine deaminase [Campylobacterales bacterium]|nr:cytidine deaminase [Campylobacterales bacterium]NQY54523.1 cytidine deaminase [Campylobacteraceae bacterium]